MKKKKLLLHLSDQYDQLHADVELLKETVQKLIDGKSRYISNETPKLTQAENKTKVLAMREEWEAKKEAKIKEGCNKREEAREREITRSVFYKGNGT